MKKRILASLIALSLLTTTFAACSSMNGDYGYPPMSGSHGWGDDFASDSLAPGGSDAAPSGSVDGDKESSDIDPVDPVDPPTEIPNPYPDYQYVAGQLTAGAYFDQEHLDYLYSLIGTTQEGKGAFNSYYSSINLSIDNLYQLTFTGVRCGTVELWEDGTKTYVAKTDATGTAILLGKGNAEQTKAVVKYTTVGGETQQEEYTVTEKTQTFETNAASEVKNTIELMFVVDTTGSMGDEINYLKKEIDDVITKVKNANEGVTIYLALMFYRDTSDEYVTRYFDFTTDINMQKKNLSLQNADGGGDFPEAVEVAMAEAVEKQWSTTATTKILVHVADAPSHQNDENKWMTQAQKLAEKGVHIISVASSGIDTRTEFLFRMQSLITNGCYVYLTDDSGIGNSHLEPTIAETPTVEYLNSCLVRLINGYHSGDFGTAIYYKQDTQSKVN